MKPVLWALAALLAIASLMDRKGGTVEPVTGGEAVAREMRSAYCDGISKAADEFATRVDHGEFRDEASEAKAWAEIAGKVAKEVTGKTSEATAAMYKTARELPEDKQAAARAKFWREFGRGMR